MAKRKFHRNATTVIAGETAAIVMGVIEAPVVLAIGFVVAISYVAGDVYDSFTNQTPKEKRRITMKPGQTSLPLDDVHLVQVQPVIFYSNK